MNEKHLRQVLDGAHFLFGSFLIESRLIGATGYLCLPVRLVIAHASFSVSAAPIVLT